MKLKLFSALALLMTLGWNLPSSASDEQSRSLKNALALFPGYHLLKLQERDPDVQAFLRQHFSKENPSVIRADFNGDGIFDYAVLVENDKTGVTKLLVFLCSTNGKCKSVYETNETSAATFVYLRVVSKGSNISAMGASPDDAPALKLHSTGIEVDYFEKASIVLYWDQKHQKIKEVSTGD